MPTFPELFHSYVVEIIVVILVTATIAFFGRAKEKWSWPTMMLYALVSIACALFIFDRLMQPRHLAVEVIDEGNIESKITEWLDAFGLGRTKVTDPSCYFNFQMGGNPPITIGRTKDHSHYLTFVSKIALDARDQAFLNKLPQEQKAAFLMELRSELAKVKTGYILDPTGALLSVTVHRRIPITAALNEATFLREIDEIEFAFTLVNDTVELGLLRRGQLMPPSPNPDKAASPP